MLSIMKTINRDYVTSKKLRKKYRKTYFLIDSRNQGIINRIMIDCIKKILKIR